MFIKLKESKKGFSLPELVIALSISSIMMLGMSTFFASSFHNLSRTQQQAQATQKQFIGMEIFRQKFSHLKERLMGGTPAVGGTPGDNYILFRNDRTDALPFTFLGLIGGRLVAKDLMIFNAIKGGEYLDSGSGVIRDVATGDEVFRFNRNNASSFVKQDNIYYIALPLENKIIKCDFVCSDLEFDQALLMPTDIATDRTDLNTLYVTDSGNNRVVMLDLLNKHVEPIATGFKFPTGISRVDDVLFVADTLNHLVRRIDLRTTPKTITTVAGSGDDDRCDGTTAKYCKLNFPTGLHVQGNELYIADSGADSDSGRILKVKDPGLPLIYDFPSKLLSNTMLSKITFSFPAGTTLGSITEVIPNTLHSGNYNISDNTLTYNLSTTITPDSTLTRCTPAPAVECYLDYVSVLGTNLFARGDKVTLGTDTFRVDYRDNDKVYFETNSSQTIYPVNTPIKLQYEFPAFPFQFSFSPNGTLLPSSFNTVRMDIYDSIPKIVQTEYFVIRKGDGILGTAEDTIEVLPGDYNFPTGLNTTHVVESLSGKIKPSGLLFNYFDPFLDPLLLFDYSTGAESPVTDFSFAEYGSILEAAISVDIGADGIVGNDKLYKIDAKLQ